MRGCSPGYRRNGLVVKIKPKSDVLDLSTVSNGDLLASLPIPGPKAFHGFHNIHALFHLAKDHMLAIQPGNREQSLVTRRRSAACAAHPAEHGREAPQAFSSGC